MINRDRVITECLEWRGSIWAHGQSTKGVACDCVGFIAGVGRNIGFLDPSERLENYHRIPREDFLLQQLDRYLERIELNDLQPADIIAFRRRNLITHVGFYMGDNQLIHSSNTRNVGVVVNSLDTFKRAIAQVYRIPGIKNG